MSWFQKVSNAAAAASSLAKAEYEKKKANSSILQQAEAIGTKFVEKGKEVAGAVSSSSTAVLNSTSSSLSKGWSDVRAKSGTLRLAEATCVIGGEYINSKLWSYALGFKALMSNLDDEEDPLMKINVVDLDNAQNPELIKSIFIFGQIRQQLDSTFLSLSGHANLHSISSVDKLAASVDSNSTASYLQHGFNGEVCGDLDSLYQVAELAKVKFRKAILEISDAIGLEIYYHSSLPLKAGVLLAELKGKTRALEKSQNEYSSKHPGPPFGWLFDIVRASIVCESVEQVLSVFEIVSRVPEFEIVRLKNRFVNPTPSGYRDINLNIRICVESADGQAVFHTVELQIHLLPIKQCALDSHSHATYEYFRTYFMGGQEEAIRLRLAYLLKLSELSTNDLVAYIDQRASLDELRDFISLLQSLGELPWATRLQLRVLDMVRAADGEDSLAAADEYIALMNLLLAAGDLSRLVEILQSGSGSAIKTYRAHDAKARVATALLLKAKAESMADRYSGNQVKAHLISLIDEAVAIRRELFGEDSLEYAEAQLDRIDYICARREKDDIVEQGIESSARELIASLEQKAKDNKNPELNYDAAAARAWVALARATSECRRRCEAVPLYEEAMRKLVKVHGSESYEVLNPMFSQALNLVLSICERAKTINPIRLLTIMEEAPELEEAIQITIKMEELTIRLQGETSPHRYLAVHLRGYLYALKQDYGSSSRCFATSRELISKPVRSMAKTGKTECKKSFQKTNVAIGNLYTQLGALKSVFLSFVQLMGNMGVYNSYAMFKLTRLPADKQDDFLELIKQTSVVNHEFYIAFNHYEKCGYNVPAAAASLKAACSDVASVFFAECMAGNVDGVRKIIEEDKLDINIKEDNGNTHFIIACKIGTLSVIQYLLTQSPSEYSLQYGTIVAISSDCFDIARLLLPFAAIRGDATWGKRGFNLLHCSVNSENLELVRDVITYYNSANDKSFDINSVTSDNVTAIDLALRMQLIDIAIFLKTSSLAQETRSDALEAMKAVMLLGSVEKVREFRAAFADSVADVNASDSDNKNLFMFACYFCPLLVGEFLTYGPNRMSIDLGILLSFMAERFEVVLELLSFLQSGTDYVSSIDGDSLLLVAIRSLKLEMVKQVVCYFDEKNVDLNTAWTNKQNGCNAIETANNYQGGKELVEYVSSLKERINTI